MIINVFFTLWNVWDEIVQWVETDEYNNETFLYLEWFMLYWQAVAVGLHDNVNNTWAACWIQKRANSRMNPCLREDAGWPCVTCSLHALGDVILS